MKKVFSVLVVFVMMFSLCLTAFAAGNSISCSVSKSDLKAGETFSVVVSLANNDPFKAFGVSFKFDTNLFEIVDGTWTIKNALLTDVDKEKNNAAVAYNNQVTQNGEVLIVDIKVKDGATAGKYTINVVPVMKNSDVVINVTGDSFDVTISEGSAPTTSESQQSGHTHDFGDFIVDVKPTCVEPGAKSRHCSGCNERTDVTKIDPVGHGWSEWVIDYEPTLDVVGLKFRTCSACGEKQNAEIAKLSPDGHEHVFGEWKTVVAPTCTEKGTQIRECSTCGETESMEVISPGHSYGEWKIKIMPTTEQEGMLECVCSICDITKTQVIDKLTQNVPSSSTDIFMLVVIGLGVAILVGAGVVFIIGYKKRKNM